MAKIFIGIDPGLTNTALAYFDERGQYLGVFVVRANLTSKLKKAIPKKGDRVNYKLRTVYHSICGILDNIVASCEVGQDEVHATLEGFWYRPPNKGGGFPRQANNYVFETVAGITATKCALFSRQIEFFEIMPVQVKRIINWAATGKTDPIDKDELAICIRKLMSDDAVEKILSEYAIGAHEHIIDAIAAAIAFQKKVEYSEYIKIPVRKRQPKP